jgi:ParB family chromosome partitioning protein
MSSKRGTWISGRGQTDAGLAIDQVIERQPQAGEQVQQLPDEQIEDSPYQARQPFNDMNVEDLAQGMREAGFQGVLIVRTHGDLAKRRRGLVQLVYGHRRRAAWRLICAERGQLCLLPVVVREISDEQMLTIGAQENLQRQDLDPVEEAQIVAWHEQVFFDKNQAQLGAMLGKSSDWVSVRSRIHKLPDRLKDCLRQRPRAIAQILELGPLFTQQPDVALALADRVVQENLTLARIRALVRGYERPEVREAAGMGSAERRGAATKVQEFTNDLGERSEWSARDKSHERRGAATDRQYDSDVSPMPLHARGHTDPSDAESAGGQLESLTPISDGTLLHEAADTLTLLASRAEQLPSEAISEQVLDQLETALKELRRSFTHRTTMHTV